MEKTRAEAHILRKHLDRVTNDYSDWEDRVVQIEQRLNEFEIEVGLSEIEPDNKKLNGHVNLDILDDLFNEQ